MRVMFRPAKTFRNICRYQNDDGERHLLEPTLPEMIVNIQQTIGDYYNQNIYFYFKRKVSIKNMARKLRKVFGKKNVVVPLYKSAKYIDVLEDEDAEY